MDKLQDIRDAGFLGSGWAFPVTFSAGNHQLITSAYEENINNNIDIILQTLKGERSLEPGFGSNLQKFFFQVMDESLKGKIREEVKFALLNNEPRINVLEVKVAYPDLAMGLVEIQIVYVYNQTNTRHNYVFPFYIKEGTNL